MRICAPGKLWITQNMGRAYLFSMKKFFDLAANSKKSPHKLQNTENRVKFKRPPSKHIQTNFSFPSTWSS